MSFQQFNPLFYSFKFLSRAHCLPSSSLHCFRLVTAVNIVVTEGKSLIRRCCLLAFESFSVAHWYEMGLPKYHLLFLILGVTSFLLPHRAIGSKDSGGNPRISLSSASSSPRALHGILKGTTIPQSSFRTSFSASDRNKGTLLATEDGLAGISNRQRCVFLGFAYVPSAPCISIHLLTRLFNVLKASSFHFTDLGRNLDGCNVLKLALLST